MAELDEWKGCELSVRMVSNEPALRSYVSPDDTISTFAHDIDDAVVFSYAKASPLSSSCLLLCIGICIGGHSECGLEVQRGEGVPRERGEKCENTACRSEKEVGLLFDTPSPVD